MAARTVSITEFKSRRRAQVPGKLDLFTLNYLRRGLSQPGGKLPLFDLDGQEVDPVIIRRCIADGLAEPWFRNPIMPDPKNGSWESACWVRIVQTQGHDPRSTACRRSPWG